MTNKIIELDRYHIKKLSKIIEKFYPNKSFNLEYDRYTEKINLTVNMKENKKND